VDTAQRLRFDEILYSGLDDSRRESVTFVQVAYMRIAFYFWGYMNLNAHISYLKTDFGKIKNGKFLCE
jgi:hypothetical protein